MQNKLILTTKYRRYTYGDALFAGSRPHLGVELLPSGQEVSHGLVSDVDNTKPRDVHTTIAERTQIYIIHTLQTA